MKNLIKEIVQLNYQYLRENQKLTKMLDSSSKLSSAHRNRKAIFNPQNAIENASILTLPRCKSCQGTFISSKQRKSNNSMKKTKTKLNILTTINTSKNFFPEKQRKLQIKRINGKSNLDKNGKIIKRGLNSQKIIKLLSQESFKSMKSSSKIPPVSSSWLFQSIK